MAILIELIYPKYIIDITIVSKSIINVTIAKHMWITLLRWKYIST